MQKISNSKHDLLLIPSFHFNVIWSFFAVSSWEKTLTQQTRGGKNWRIKIHCTFVALRIMSRWWFPRTFQILFVSREFPFSPNDHIAVDIMLCHIVPFVYISHHYSSHTWPPSTQIVLLDSLRFIAFINSNLRAFCCAINALCAKFFPRGARMWIESVYESRRLNSWKNH